MPFGNGHLSWNHLGGDVLFRIFGPSSVVVDGFDGHCLFFFQFSLQMDTSKSETKQWISVGSEGVLQVAL